MPEQGHAENFGRISDRRSYPRQEIKFLCYVNLSDMNGAVLVNLSEGGLALQAVANLREEQLSRMRFQLSESASLLETGGRITWISPSRRLAGIEFVNLSDTARRQIRKLIALEDSPLELQEGEPMAPAEEIEIPSVASNPLLMPEQVSDLAVATSVLKADTLMTVVEKVRFLTRADGAAIALREAQDVRCVASTGDAPPVGSRLQPDSVFTRECIETGRIMHCDDAETDSRIRPSIARALHLRSVLAVPIQDQGSILGLVQVFSSRTAAFNTTHLSALQHMAELLVPFSASGSMQDEQPGDNSPRVPGAPASAFEEQLVERAADSSAQQQSSEVSAGSTNQQFSELRAVLIQRLAAKRRAWAGGTGLSLERGKLLAGSLTVGIIFGTGAYLMFRSSANGNRAPKHALVLASDMQHAVTQPAEATMTRSTKARGTSTSNLQTLQTAQKNNLVAEVKRAEPTVAATLKTAKQGETPDVERTRTPAAEKGNVAAVTSNLFGSLNAHPVAGRSADPQTDAAPALEAAAPSLDASDALPTVPSPSVVAPPVPTQMISGRPLQVGGLVPEPKLLTSTTPIYPTTAKQTGTEGSVVLRTVIDEQGHVADAQVVSGPILLRQAAVDAVKHWKYEPSKVNGKPVAVQILVTIHFRL